MARLLVPKHEIVDGKNDHVGTAKSGAAEMSNTPYLDRARLRFPEVLSRIDQEPFSLTYGCGDRNYWGWKFTDFPGARFQEFLFTLAWIKTASPDDCIWRNSAFLDDTIKAGFCWWRHIQHADGSFDEAYPNEKSLAATAFTLFYASESFVRIRNTLAPEEQRKTLEAMHRAADWLCQNDETHGVLSNHLAAAAAALWNAHGLLGEAAHRDRAEHFIRRIRSRQSKEGWYEEYGGADIGYQTHCSFYLARIWQKSRDGELLESLRRANAFLSHFVHPDGSIGGEYASRGTKFYFPAAFEMLWEECDVARSIAEFQRVNIAEGRGIGVGQMDEYNLYPMLNNYLFAEDAHRSRRGVGGSSNPLPWQKEQCVLFEDAGLAVESRRRHFAIIGVGGGGTQDLGQRYPRSGISKHGLRQGHGKPLDHHPGTVDLEEIRIGMGGHQFSGTHQPKGVFNPDVSGFQDLQHHHRPRSIFCDLDQEAAGQSAGKQAQQGERHLYAGNPLAAEWQTDPAGSRYRQTEGRDMAGPVFALPHGERPIHRRAGGSVPLWSGT